MVRKISKVRLYLTSVKYKVVRDCLCCSEYLSSLVHLVWNEEDESSSVLKAISVAIETEAEADDQAMVEGDREETPIEESKVEDKFKMVEGENFS